MENLVKNQVSPENENFEKLPNIWDMIEYCKMYKEVGDIKEASDKLGRSAQTFRNALYRKNNKFTTWEIKMVVEVYRIIKARIDFRRSIGIES